VEKDYAFVLTDKGKGEKLKILSQSMIESSTASGAKQP